MTGIELIAKERKEQLVKHARTIKEDLVNNKAGQLGHAAFLLLHFYPVETIPTDWNENIWRHMISKPYKERIIIAGALIAAELDRMIIEDIIELYNNKYESI